MRDTSYGLQGLDIGMNSEISAVFVFCYRLPRSAPPVVEIAAHGSDQTQPEN
jgi:hypothetical protein